MRVTIVSTDANKRGSDAEKGNTATGANNGAGNGGRDAEKGNATTGANNGAGDGGSDVEKGNATTGANNGAGKRGSDVEKGSAQKAGAATAADEGAVDSIAAMFTALRACWVPPPKDKARQGMEYTVRFAFKRDGEVLAPPRRTYSSHDAPTDVRDVYRDAINAALARCTPLHFSREMAEAVAGRPIAIRFVDNRTVDSAKTSQ
ncbi:MAG TPA: hypothetical protein VGJ20_02660 [Xanthobacteraceae bacterium]